MTVFLLSEAFLHRDGEAFRAACDRGGIRPEVVLLPDDPDARLSPQVVARVEVAFFSGDIFARGLGRSFFAATQGAPNLRWLHVFHAGVDNPVFGRFLERGVRLTTSSGSTAAPIARTAITGMLMLSRGFPAWLDAQRRRTWIQHPPSAIPDDLDGQVMLVVGLGAIGSEIARLARVFGLHVIGIRRSPRRDDDPVDEVRPPSELLGLLPSADWLALACPLTSETRRLVDAGALAALKPGARILNIARGEVIDETALIAALERGHVGGAYLDVFEEEPLPPTSPLWEMANVIVTPHNSAASTGNEERVRGYFLRNIEAWGRGEPLVNEVTASDAGGM